MKVPGFLWHCSRGSQIIKFIILEVSLSFTWARSNTPNYQGNNGFLEKCFRVHTMQKVCRWRFLSFFGTAHVIQKLKIFFLWKFHWVWREVVGMRRNIKKMTDICKIVLGSGQCQKCVDVGSWVSLALLMSLGISKVF